MGKTWEHGLLFRLLDQASPGEEEHEFVVRVGDTDPHRSGVDATRIWFPGIVEQTAVGMAYPQSGFTHLVEAGGNTLDGVDFEVPLSGGQFWFNDWLHPAPEMWFKPPLLAMGTAQEVVALADRMRRTDTHAVWEADVLLVIDAIVPMEVKAPFGQSREHKTVPLGVKTWVMATIVRDQTDDDGVFLLRTPDGSDLGYLDACSHEGSTGPFNLRKAILQEYWFLLAADGRADIDANPLYELSRLFHERYFYIYPDEFKSVLVEKARADLAVPSV